jgi:hypothetical protein
VTVHTHPGHHFKKRPRSRGHFLVDQVSAGRDNSDEASKIGEIAPPHSCLIEPGKFCKLSGAAVESPEEVPMLSENGEELIYDRGERVRLKPILLQCLF